MEDRRKVRREESRDARVTFTARIMCTHELGRGSDKKRPPPQSVFVVGFILGGSEFPISAPRTPRSIWSEANLPALILVVGGHTKKGLILRSQLDYF